MKEQTADTSFWARLPFKPNRNQIARFLVSLLIATFLWGWVTQLNDPFQTMIYRELDVSVEPLGDSLEVVTTLPRVAVTIEGPESEVSSIDRTDISVTLDTSEIQEAGEYRAPLIVSAPEGPSQQTVDPGEIPITVEEHVSEEMLVEVERTVNENDPREVISITPDTTQVTVSGPSSAVNRVDRVVLPVTIDNQSATFEETYTPYAVDTNGQRVSEVEVLPGQIETTVEIQTRGKTVSVIPRIVGIPAEGYSVQQRAALPGTVVVDGPEEALETLLFVNTEPVDVTDATQSISRSVGLADLPAGVTVIDPPGGQVEVRVALENISSSAQTLTALPVQTINLGDGLDAELSSRTLDVTLDGLSSELAQMTPEDVKVRLDLEGLGPGTHDIAPEITVPQGVTWVSNTPETIEVMITGSEQEASTPEPQVEALVPQATSTSSRTRHCVIPRPRIADDCHRTHRSDTGLGQASVERFT